VSVADVLVVEDAPEYAELISVVLGRDGHEVRRAPNFSAAVAEMTSRMPELVVLDLALPDGDGLDLCRAIREHSDAYVVVVSGRADAADTLMGFRLGADDFVLKPFSGRELSARVEALLRRPRRGEAPMAVRVFDELRIDTTSREVSVGGIPVELTRIEFDLLEMLAADPRNVFTRQQMLDHVWGEGWFGDDHVVDVHMANLRKKIDLPSRKSFVRTVRGVGYSMAH
jgi:DNA-binding response OmpR family regulator